MTLMGVRLYNSTTGRFLSADPVDGGSANAYEYCNADPVNQQDLDGLWAKARSMDRYWGSTKQRKTKEPPAYAMAKGGNQRHRHTDLADKSDKELQEMKKAAKGKEKRKLEKELKARGIRHRGGGGSRKAGGAAEYRGRPVFVPSFGFNPGKLRFQKY